MTIKRSEFSLAYCGTERAIAAQRKQTETGPMGSI